jgi:LCP family protein required for cell wall assembly
MRSKAIVLVLAMTSWVAGSAVGALTTSTPAAAQTADAGMVLGKVHAGATPSLDGSKPIVILVIGSGARRGDDVLHSLGDSLHLAYLNPAKHSATLVGIPRDSYVPIPGNGSNKINASMVYGGPELLAKTIEDRWDVQIDYWALTTFWELIAMVNTVGGLTVDVPFAMSDSASRADLQPGVQVLSGEETLAFSRNRHGLLQGDFGRQENGGRVMVGALSTFQKAFKADPSKMLVWIGAGMRNMQTDLSLDEITDLFFTATHMSAKKVRNIVLPGSALMQGGISIVQVDETWAKRIFTDLQNDGVLAAKNVPPSPTADG